MTVVLDASAVLALLYDESGKDLVIAHAQGALVLSVNLSEVLTRVIDKGGNAERVRKLLQRLELTIVPFDEDLAVLAAKLRTATKSVGASLGDRACLALAASCRVPVLTADRDWARLDLGLDIRLIR